MAWTATLTAVTKDNQNTLAHISYVENGGTPINEATPSTTWTPASLKAWVFRRIAQLAARDTSQAAITPLVGTSITAEASPPDAPALIQFRKDWNELHMLRKLNSADAALVTATNNRLAACTTYVKANPDAVNDQQLIR